MSDSAFLWVLKGRKINPPPIWLMRQAGRYLPEYRKLRQEQPSFVDFCLTPALTVEATLQPIRRFGFDAAILFADILLIPHALGQKVWFEEGYGPRLESLTSPEGLKKLRLEQVNEILSPVFKTVQDVRAQLSPETVLIGFAGGPWTVATYMVAGRGGDDQKAAKQWAFADPESFDRLIDCITEATIDYLAAQAHAGAQALQIFESWGGALTSPHFERWCVAPTKKICEGLKKRGVNVPVIGFPRGAGALLPVYAKESGVSAVSVDSDTSPVLISPELPKQMALQGNLDPVILQSGKNLEQEAIRVCKAFRTHPHIFNLGHGILPDTPIEHVHRLVETVRSFKASTP